MMSSLVVLNIACFLSAVDLKQNKRELFANYSHSASMLFLAKEENAANFNYCTVGLLSGFFLITIFSLVRFKKLFLSYLAKLMLVFYNLNFIFDSSISQ